MKRFLFVILSTAALVTLMAVAPPQSVRGQVAESKLLRTERKIPNKYIVVLEDWAAGPRGLLSRSHEVAWELGIVYGGRIDRVFRHAINGFVVEMSEEQAKVLSRDSRVRFIEEDAEMSINAVQSYPPWGLDRIDQLDLPVDNSYQYDATGAGVRAYIIDSGIRASHSDFGGRVLSGFSAINDGRGTSDCNGHGTHVAGTTGGTTWGVAKNVSLIPVRVLDCEGSGPTSGVISGVDWVTANHVKPAVANMSLGGGTSASLDNAVSNSINAGVTYVVAAGNDNKNACGYSPARVAGAITVGATTIGDVRASYSNFGNCLDVFAPGSSIKSAWYTGNTATSTISGTSMASPHVAGAAALYLQNNPNAAPSAVTSAIVGNGTPGKVASIGSGSINLLLYLALDGSPEPIPSPTPTPSVSPTPTPVSSPTPVSDVRVNFARPQNGGTASSSSGFAPPAIDGNRVWAIGGSWKDVDPFVYPDWLQVDFNGSKTIDEIGIYGVRDDYLNIEEPTISTVSTVFGIVNFNVEYWNGTAWASVPGGNISGNNLVLRKLTFSPITTSRIRVLVNSAHDGYSRIVELEAWGGGTPAPQPSPTSTVVPSPTPTIAPSPTPTPAASPTPGSRTNVALASNGGVATASTALSSPSLAVDGIKSWAISGSWKDLTPFVYPDWLQVDFNGSKTIDEIGIYGVRDDYLNTAEPTGSTVSTVYGIANFNVQYWTGAAWADVPGGNVTGNNLVVRKFTFAPITTPSIRVLINSAHDGYSRIVELEAWSGDIPDPLPAAVPVYGYQVINTYPHDPQAFTQGLLYHNGFLYESTGRVSTLRKVEIQTGNVLQKFDLPSDNFAEGIALHNGNIFQLTWLNQFGRVFNVDSFEVIRQFNYQGEGWGLASDGSHMFMSDGSNVIRVLDTTTFNLVRTISVLRDDGQPLRHLNELEYVNGEIWANIWGSDNPDILGKPNHIARINPANGKLLGWINLDGISPDDVARDLSNTLNGIAYDAGGDRIFVTGKNWTKLFEIVLTPPE